MSIVRAATWMGLLAVAVPMACAHTESSTERVCTPGNYVFCRCKDLSAGTKQCSDDGLGFDKCSACQPSDEVPPTTDGLDAESPDTKVETDGGGRDTSSDAPPAADKAAPGDFLITEVMYDPSGTEPDQEWLEIFNASSKPRLLSGLALRDGGNRSTTIPAEPPIVVAAGQYVILVRNQSAATAALVPVGPIVFEYGAGVAVTQGILLANGAGGAVWLVDGTTTIAGAPYGGWFSQTAPGGHTAQLKTLTLTASGPSAAWCLSDTSWASGSDLGTPGQKNDCP